MRNRMEPIAPIVERALPYRAAERIAPCVCGGFVVADPVSEKLVELAVKAHQGTLRHQNWLARSGW